MIKVTYKLEKLAKIIQKVNGLRDLVSRDDADKISKLVIEEMQKMISKGISPIEGNGRFPGYKNPKTGYPSTVRNRFKDKQDRPVNLKLSGKFLDNLKHKLKRSKFGWGSEIGFFEKPWKDYESGHREGVNTQPKRPIIPNIESGELPAQRIQRIISGIIRERLKQYLRK